MEFTMIGTNTNTKTNANINTNTNTQTKTKITGCIIPYSLPHGIPVTLVFRYKVHHTHFVKMVLNSYYEYLMILIMTVM